MRDRRAQLVHAVGVIWLVLLLCLPLPAAAGDRLRIGTSGDYAPFSAEGRGFDLEVARRFARSRGLEVEWVPFRWPELAERVASGEFAIAMSGITWRPDRAVAGHLSRAVAVGGPCVLSRLLHPRRIGVNRGGFLERWARQRFPDRELVSVRDNRSLPARLERGEIDALVTDSFELPHFRREGLAEQCEPARERKVYWVAPARAAELGPALDAWLRTHEPELRELRETWLGSAQARGESDHLVDLLARRLAFMPHVVAWKRARGIAIADPARERTVLDRAVERAREHDLGPARMRAFFALQIELAKRVQSRAATPATVLDLEREVRPALLRIGDRIVASLARGARLDAADLAPLGPWLRDEEIAELRAALQP